MASVMAYSWKVTRRTFLSLSAGAGLSILAGGGPSILVAAGERRIFSSGRIGNLRLKNRLVRSATAENAWREGVMTDEGIAIYRALGQGQILLFLFVKVQQRRLDFQKPFFLKEIF